MEHFKQNLTGGLRRLAMAGVGAITLTVDKSREIIDQLASRGEVTAAEGQAACDELHKKLAEQVSAFTQKLRADYETLSFEQMLSRCQKLTPEQKQQLIDKLTAQLGEAAADENASAYSTESEENETPENSTDHFAEPEAPAPESAAEQSGTGEESAVQTESSSSAEAFSPESEPSVPAPPQES